MIGVLHFMISKCDIEEPCIVKRSQCASFVSHSVFIGQFIHWLKRSSDVRFSEIGILSMVYRAPVKDDVKGSVLVLF